MLARGIVGLDTDYFNLRQIGSYRFRVSICVAVTRLPGFLFVFAVMSQLKEVSKSIDTIFGNDNIPLYPKNPFSGSLKRRYIYSRM